MDTAEQFAAHKFFAATLFNSTWDLIDLPTRTPEQDEEMILRASASYYHWTQRQDCTPRNLSIGAWQLSRVHALAGRAADSLRWAEHSVSHGVSGKLAPFYLGYAFEARARALFVAGEPEEARQALELAFAQLELVEDNKSREMLAVDLEGLDA
jgi:hypothetical protein